ncbi:MAG TPA: hypothetical protein VKZ49_13030 [Polyangiaceae bacterium]|nr:hypothetical protein [Polyangiaceae bacterium]
MASKSQRRSSGKRRAGSGGARKHPNRRQRTSKTPSAAPLGAAQDWEDEAELRFFSYTDELAPGPDHELALEDALVFGEPEPTVLTAAQLARRSTYRRLVARAMAGLSVFTIGAVTARLVLGS